MEKYLVTGFSGFVAKHFLDFLDEQEVPAYVLGVDIHRPEFNIYGFKYVRCSFERTDLLDKDQVDNIIYQFQPSYILHLASFSSVAFSWKNPVASFANNTNIFLNLLEKVRGMNLDCRILSIGSSEEYGNVHAEDMPLKEEHPLNPISPYAVARVSQEMLSTVYVEGYGMDIVMTRSFNHIGPGQRDLFVISSFAKQLVSMARIEGKAHLVTGDTSIIRDFVDVRDVVRAYYLLLKKGKKGEIYNICSGTGTTLKEVLDKMGMILGTEVENQVNEKFIRPNDNQIIIGSNDKIKEAIGFEPSIPLDESLRDIIEYWKEQIEQTHENTL
ncbi:GDP-mannose 4,6-dehydratase [Pontibacter pamirensis]|uniref:GDP-mannose 4,6-dehydratase n=1 Tax=Pontibacter pamirensis TaxID=2562824 RepID=UPI001389F4E9|nr:GDP-mannose 4,6-dehydratase [Pontibacter pamirensis]